MVTSINTGKFFLEIILFQRNKKAILTLNYDLALAICGTVLVPLMIFSGFFLSFE
jgi:hypothetical protein